MSDRPQNLIPVVLVSLQLPKQTDKEIHDSLRELERLASTLGYRNVGTIIQARQSDKTSSVLGEGKLVKLAQLTGGTGQIAATFQRKKSKAAEKFQVVKKSQDVVVSKNEVTPEILAKLVIFDCDLSPSQLRNVESAVGVPVLDRTGVIIEIFSRHAKTKAAKLQIEIAQLNYSAPRMRESSGGSERSGGGIGAKGVGETKAELDSRRIKDRIKELKRELASIQIEQKQRRQRRAEENCVALIGYTNAGKSSLMQALTGSEVLVANQLFATLDTTIRPLMPETKPKILVSDTVGFINKLPHDLVASFKTTLDEALNASILLLVVDASDPAFRSQLDVTRHVLRDMGADMIPAKLILNKTDLLTDEQKAELKKEFPSGILISTRNPKSITDLRNELVEFFEKDMIDGEIFVKYGSEKTFSEIRSLMRILKEEYDNDGVHLKVRSNADDLSRLKKKLGL